MKLTRLIFSSTVLSLALHAQAPAPAAPTQPRLLCLFLALDSMTPADQTRARDAAIEYVQTKLPPFDAVAVMTYTSQVNVLQDFTNDRNSVLALLRAITLSPRRTMTQAPAFRRSRLWLRCSPTCRKRR